MIKITFVAAATLTLMQCLCLSIYAMALDSSPVSISQRHASTQSRLEGLRADVLRTIYSNGSLPTKQYPDRISPTNVTGMMRIEWDLDDEYIQNISSTGFYYPVISKGSSASGAAQRARCLMIHHHGHAQGCDAKGCTWW